MSAAAPSYVLAVIEREMVKRAADRTAFAKANAPKMVALCEQFETQAIEVHAAIAELIQTAETAEKVIRNLVTAGAHPNWAHYADDLRNALVRVGGAP